MGGNDIGKSWPLANPGMFMVIMLSFAFGLQVFQTFLCEYRSSQQTQVLMVSHLQRNVIWSLNDVT